MLLTASRTSLHARILHSRASSLSVIAPSSVALLQSRHGQQCREFCFGSWSSNSNSEPQSHRGGRRRHIVLRYRYMERLNRNLSNNNLGHEHPTGTAKKGMAQFARTAEGRHANANTVKSWSDDLTGARPGNNIEDVERSAINHLFSSEKHASDAWKSPLSGIRDYLRPQSASTSQDSSYIDPITNRRAARQSSKYQDLDKYEPQSFDEAIPTIPQPANPKYNDLAKYGPIEDTGAEHPIQAQAQYDDVDKYGPVQWNEPDGLRKSTPEEDTKKYDDLHKYSSSELDDPFTQRKLTPEEQSKMYDDLDKYQPVHWNEPDGLRPETVEELSKNYDDLHKYTAVHWNEPDGLRKPTPEELSKNYQDLGEYGPVAWSEPDGLRKLTPEEESKKYTDLEAYHAPFTAEDSTLRAHQAASMDRTVKGTPLPTKVDAPIQDLTQKYDDLHLYGPVHWNEPDGLRKLTPEELSKNYDDLHLYGAVQWNEPDGLRKLTPEEKSKQYQDVGLYSPRDLAGASKRIHPEEASKNYKDLPKYYEYDNGDPATPRIHPEEASKQYSDLSKYSGGYEEPEVTQHVHPEELTKGYEDLDSYEPSSFDDPTEPFMVDPDIASKAYKDLYKYNAIHIDEPTGKLKLPLDPVASGLKDYDSKAGSQLTDNGPIAYQQEKHRFPSDPSKSNVEFLDTLTAQDIRASTLRRAKESSQTLEQETTQAQSNAALTGNYARDFPEDFATSWSAENSLAKSALLPKGQAEAAETAVAEARDTEPVGDTVEPNSVEESFSFEASKIQPALDRQSSLPSKEVEDPYSLEPQGLETSFSEEFGGKDTLPTIQKHWTGSDNPQAGGPTLYKILAYDSTSQMMNIAEATSKNHDETSTSGPAEALLRLANPSKFLPHFKDLEAQGYEIVSGNGDVLVFRKVRPASSVDTLASLEEIPMPSMPINPIDMMGRPTVGNFASPTGYVNYESLDEQREKPAPPFRSDVDAKEDESGLGKQKETKDRKKRSLGKKMVLGIVWVAGSIYAVGVVGEYFSTRGLDAEARPRRR